MEKNTDRLIFWAPRVLSILFLAFLAMFSLDIFDTNLGFWGTLVGLFMHNLPVLFLAVILAIAWKHDIVGAIFYCLAGLVFFGLILSKVLRNGFEFYMLSYPLIIAGPAFLISGLFFVGWLKKRC